MFAHVVKGDVNAVDLKVTFADGSQSVIHDVRDSWHDNLVTLDYFVRHGSEIRGAELRLSDRPYKPGGEKWVRRIEVMTERSDICETEGN